MTFRADLHLHSNFSDGTDSLEEIFKKASSMGLSALSITDHDTIAAYTTAFEISKKYNILLLPGVEISALFKEESIHVLAYSFSPENKEMRNFLNEQQEKRMARNERIFQKLKNLGIAVDEKTLHTHSLGRPHIAEMMIKQGVVSSQREAFDKYLGEGKPAYDPGLRLSVAEVIEMIQRAKGLAVLAHPHLIRKKRVLRHLLDLPFDGIECYYAKIPSTEEKPFLDMAEKRGWIATGGSDYHGMTKPHITLGCSWVNETIFQRLYDHFLKNIE